jgi:hypothetical protein
MQRRTALFALGGWVLFAAFLRLVVVPAEVCGEPSAHDLRNASAAASDWIERALLPSGRYVYIYNADTDSQPRSYNEVRHAGVTMALYQSAGRGGDERAFETADEALEWMLDHLYRQDGWAALTDEHGRRAKLGATALMLNALAERRLATGGDPSYDALMEELGRFLISMQREDGGFHIAFDVGPREPDLIGTSRYFPGEALWALALLHEALPDPAWEQGARRAARFISTMRDDVEGVEYPPLNDHWASYGFAEMAEWGLEEPEIEYARRLAARFGFLVRAEAQLEGGGIAALTRGDEPRRAASLGTWVEGMAALWRLSVADERLADLSDDIAERLACAGAILADRQYDADEAAASANPALVEGAWFSGSETRMDDQQHALSGLLYAADALDGRGQREPDVPLSLSAAIEAKP